MRGRILPALAVALAVSVTTTRVLAQSNSNSDKKTEAIPVEEQAQAPHPAPQPKPAHPSLMPDFSVIGNNLGRFLGARGDRERNHLQLGEFELGLQEKINSGIRFGAFLTGDPEQRRSVSTEEAYAALSNVARLPLGAFAGRKLLDIGKVNPIHSHARPYADQPAVLNYFLGREGVAGNGASANYTLPMTNLFVNLELGLWEVSPAGKGFLNDGGGLRPGSRIATGAFYPVGLGVSHDFPLAKLSLSHAFNKVYELELGASHGFGRAGIGDRIDLTGLDLTYRSFPNAFKRLLVQAEVFWHHRDDAIGGTGGHTRSGHYAFVSYRPNLYAELGVRFDNTTLPWPFPGREQSLSLIWTDRLTEVTQLRVQLKHGDRTNSVFLPAERGYTEAWLQFVWGGGSHRHPIQ